MSVDDYIEQLSPDLQRIVVQLRQIITASHTDITEAIKWRAPVYTINTPIAAIIAHRRHVNLQLFRGADISAAPLQGTGKLMRHLRFTDHKQIDSRMLERVLQQAIKLDQGR